MSARGLGMLVGLAVCACTPPMEPVGRSTAGAGALPPTEPDAPPPVVFDAALRASLQPMGRGERTLGHSPGRFSYRLLGNELAKQALSADAPWPQGSWLGIEQTTRDGQAGPAYFMEKRTGGPFGGWHFVATEPDGSVLEQGALELCGVCHRDAARDYVFPPAQWLEPAP